MTEPTTPIKALIIPNTGDLVGAWGTAAMNVDWTAVDGMLGGSQIISLASATTFTLSAPAGSITPGAGPNQAQNAFLQFSGTLTGNAVITLPLPGHYIVNNNCTVGTFFVQFRAAGTGTLVGIPDGRPVKVWCDGTNVNFCDPPEVASFLDLCMATTPSWFTGCSTLPYLICDSTVYTSSLYPVLSQRLGSTFGGNGITTFAVPDLRARYRLPLDNQGSQGAAGRVTTLGSSINGTTAGAAGGAQNQTLTQAQLPAVGLSFSASFNFLQLIGGSFTGINAGSGTQNLAQSSPSGVTNNMGSGQAHPIMPPTLVTGMTLIKT